MSQGQARSSSKIISIYILHHNLIANMATDGQSDWQEGHRYWTTQLTLCFKYH